jgi:hypothetical protein
MAGNRISVDEANLTIKCYIILLADLEVYFAEQTCSSSNASDLCKGKLVSKTFLLLNCSCKNVYFCK